MSRFAALETAILHGRPGQAEVERVHCALLELADRTVVVETAFDVPERLPHGVVIGLEVRRADSGLLAVARRIARGREVPGELALEVIGGSGRVTARIAELAG